MKKLMLIAAVTIASVSAHASKARLNSLQNAAHLSDFQDVVQSKPSEALNYEAATVEFGSATGTPNAEGGFVRKMGDAAWGLYLGRNSATYLSAADAAAAALDNDVANENTALDEAFSQDNSLQLTYAMKAGSIGWGVGLFYVSNDFKNGKTFAEGTSTFTADKKQNIMGLVASAGNGTWDAQLRQGFSGKTEINDVSAEANMTVIANGQDLELNSTSSTKIRGGYLMDTMYFYGALEMGAAELKLNDVKQADTDQTVTTIGVVNSHKKDGVDFFYGASFVMTTTKEDVADTKEESTVVPLIVGVEAEANSWLVLRGALTQNLSLLSSSKPDGGSAASTDDSTVTTLGAGIKWGKAMVDLTLGTGSSGTLGFDDDGNNFANGSITYNF